MRFLKPLIFCWVCLFSAGLSAQQSFSIQIPDAQITANRVLKGDADTYGLGDWHCNFWVSLEGTAIKVDGKISFTEKANDFTTIVGSYHQRIEIGELERCKHCSVSLGETFGQVKGPNIGARGYQWFEGSRLIRRANIQTDVFGMDAGNIGGTVQFMPIKVLVDCSIAETPKKDLVVPIYVAREDPD